MVWEINDMEPGKLGTWNNHLWRHQKGLFMLCTILSIIWKSLKSILQSYLGQHILKWSLLLSMYVEHFHHWLTFTLIANYIKQYNSAPIIDYFQSWTEWILLPYSQKVLVNNFNMTTRSFDQDSQFCTHCKLEFSTKLSRLLHYLKYQH